MAKCGDQAELKKMFDAVDLDGSGEIHAREFIQVITTMLKGKGMSESDADSEAKAQVYALLKKYDKNEDMKISWEEFVAGMNE